MRWESPLQADAARIAFGLVNTGQLAEGAVKPFGARNSTKPPERSDAASGTAEEVVNVMLRGFKADSPGMAFPVLSGSMETSLISCMGNPAIQTSLWTTTPVGSEILSCQKFQMGVAGEFLSVTVRAYIFPATRGWSSLTRATFAAESEQVQTKFDRDGNIEYLAPRYIAGATEHSPERHNDMPLGAVIKKKDPIGTGYVIPARRVTTFPVTSAPLFSRPRLGRY